MAFYLLNYICFVDYITQRTPCQARENFTNKTPIFLIKIIDFDIVTGL